MGRRTKKNPEVTLGRRQRRRKEQRRKNVREVISTILYLAILCVAVYFILHYVGQSTVVRGDSMDTTLSDGQNLIMDKLSYHFRDPERYDIVIFKYPDDPSKIFIKRVIGLPGETVTVKDGKIYIDGKEQTQAVSFCPEEMAGSFGPYEVPEDSYFVMGDNRNNSLDSRYWDNTYVKKEAILAKAGFRYWPLNKVGFVNKSAEK